jgi:hypothetical protein
MLHRVLGEQMSKCLGSVADHFQEDGRRISRGSQKGDGLAS